MNPNRPICPVCNQPILPEHETVEIGDETYHENCTVECEDCGERVPIDQSHDVVNSTVCDTCYDENYSECDHCGEIVPTDEMTQVGNEWWCDRCREDHATQCEDCGDYVPDDEANTVTVSFNQEEQRCQTCCEDLYYCEECEDYIDEDQEIKVYSDTDGLVLDLMNEDQDPDTICQTCAWTESNHISWFIKGADPAARRFCYYSRIDPRTADRQLYVVSPQIRIKRNTVANNNHVFMVELYTAFAPIGTDIPTGAVRDNIHGLLLSWQDLKDLASIEREHGGIGLNHAEGIISEEQSLELADIYNQINQEVIFMSNNGVDIDPLVRKEVKNLAEVVEAITRQRQGMVRNNNTGRMEPMLTCIFGEPMNESENVGSYDVPICAKHMYGGLCPECMQAHRPVCSSCMARAAKRLEEMQTTLFDTLCNRTINRYHQERDSFIKTMKYRDKDEKPYLYYGIELEMCIPGNKDLTAFAKDMLKAGKGLFVCESDSSLDNGVEFISRPVSYKKWVSPEVKTILKDMRSVAVKYDYDKAHQRTAGMHIHMSKIFFQRNTTKTSIEQITDMAWIIQAFEPELRKINGRELGRYNQSAVQQVEEKLKYNIQGLGVKEAKLEAKIDKTGARSEHTYVVHETPRTLEIRSFKGTSDPLEILARIELCRNIAHFVRKQKIEGMTLKQLLGLKESPNLDKYCKANKINIDEKKKAADEVKITITLKDGKVTIK